MAIQRIDVPEIPYHVFARGNNKEAIFIDEIDRLFYLKALREARKQFQYVLYTYALMNNHFHLMLKMLQGFRLANLMHHVQLRYAAYFCRRYRRVGHVFQSRYHSNLIETDRYFLTVDRYIHLNPVRAGLAEKPEDFRWSSYNARFQTPASDWINHGEILEWFGKERSQQQQAYREFTEAAIGTPEEWPHDLLRKTTYLGSSEFVEKIRSMPLAKITS